MSAGAMRRRCYGAMRYGIAVPTRYGAVVRSDTNARWPACTLNAPRSLCSLTRPTPTLSCNPLPAMATNSPVSTSRLASGGRTKTAACGSADCAGQKARTATIEREKGRLAARRPGPVPIRIDPKLAVRKHRNESAVREAQLQSGAKRGADETACLYVRAPDQRAHLT